MMVDGARLVQGTGDTCRMFRLTASAKGMVRRVLQLIDAVDADIGNRLILRHRLIVKGRNVDGVAIGLHQVDV